jgi:hypothetical protein
MRMRPDIPTVRPDQSVVVPPWVVVAPVPWRPMGVLPLSRAGAAEGTWLEVARLPCRRGAVAQCRGVVADPSEAAGNKAARPRGALGRRVEERVPTSRSCSRALALKVDAMARPAMWRAARAPT